MTWLAHTRRARRALLACALAVCGLVFAARAQPKAPEQPTAKPVEPTPPVDYQGLSASDPLERARAVARLGDVRVLAQLAAGPADGAIADASRVLAAVRSTPFVRDPARALLPLIPIMQGRDPDLAPAAARAAVELARRLVEEPSVSEDQNAESLRALAKQLAAIEQNLRVRADIRLAAVEAAALLNAAVERL